MVKVKKVQDGKWSVTFGDFSEIATRSNMYGGSYQIELPNGAIINAVSQDALKRMVKKYI